MIRHWIRHWTMRRPIMPRSMAKRLSLPVFAALFLLAICVPAVQAEPGAATITYRRVFKGSAPEFIEINISDAGGATFELRQLDEEPEAQPFEVGSPIRKKIFELAGALDNFAAADLDVAKRLANLGQKTFRYERDGEVHEASFNYTLNATANQLMQLFEGLARQQRHLTTLERRMKFDRLGVNDALRQFEADLAHRLLPEPERFLPVLDQIAADSRFMDLARSRARALAERVREGR
jgi:hypothetical protein